MNKNIIFYFLIIITSNLMGCSTYFVVDISSYGTNVTSPTKVFIAPGDQKVTINDVAFIEYAGYVAKALSKNGFIVVNNLDDADQVVLLWYAISDPKSQTINIPIYGPTGISSSSTFGYMNSSGNFFANTNYDYQYGLKGFVATQKIYFTRAILLVAYDWQLFKKFKKEKQIWQTQIISSGSSDDLRYVFPYMIVAAEKYIGRNTRGRVTVEVSEYDSRVREYVQSN